MMWRRLTTMYRKTSRKALVLKMWHCTLKLIGKPIQTQRSYASDTEVDALTTISPATADRAFWEASCRTNLGSGRRNKEAELQHAVPAELSHLRAAPPRLIMSRYVGVPVLFQAFNRVRLRYTAVAFYDGCCWIQVASDCVEAALARGNQWRQQFRTKRAILVIAGVDSWLLFPRSGTRGGRLVVMGTRIGDRCLVYLFLCVCRQRASLYPRRLGCGHCWEGNGVLRFASYREELHAAWDLLHWVRDALLRQGPQWGIGHDGREDLW